MEQYSKRYNINETFEFNKENGPFEEIEDRNKEIAAILGDEYGIHIDFFGFKTPLPIGVAAGPLYNARYMEGAAKDGFTVITWKTFRNADRLAHRNDGEYVGHNIVYINPEEITEDEIGQARPASATPPEDKHALSITNSFGMPSQLPSVWQKEVEDMEPWIDEHNKAVITSVVGTPAEGGSIEDLASDYALSASAAEVSGARIIEINLSCPNVSGKEGTIYKDTNNSRIIASAVRAVFEKPDTKLLIKVGFGTEEFYKGLLESCGDVIDGIVAINTIPMKIHDDTGKQALPGGETSGVCGTAILPLAVEATANLRAAVDALDMAGSIKVIGCGGVMSAEGFMAHIDAGAEYVMCATAALFNPELPLEIARYIKEHKINKTIV